MLSELISLALALVCAPALEISIDGAASRRIALDGDGRFSVTYWHSMYHAPLTEDFVVDAARELRLVAVRSDHGGVLEYLGFESAAPVQPMDRRFPRVSFLVATKEAQALVVGARRWSFREFGGPGTRVVFTPAGGCTRR
jgi:hypothetical protein